MQVKGAKINDLICIRTIFEYLPFGTCLNIIKFNKKLHDKLKLDYNTYIEFVKLKLAFKPKYEYIEKYIDFFYDEKKAKYHNKNLVGNNSFFKDIKLFYKGINSMTDNILIDISKNKKWKIILENISIIKLEINPSIIEYINKLNEKDKLDILKHLKKYRKNIKEIYFNSFKGKNEINFPIRKNINIILNSIFNTMKTNTANDYCCVKKLTFKDNSIISVLDINNILLEISNIIYNNTTFFNIESFNIDSSTVNNSIANINFCVKEKLYNLKNIELYCFDFVKDNDKNSSLLCGLFKNLKNLEKIDLSGSICDNNILMKIFDNNKILNLKVLIFEINYGDKLVNWKFLKNYINTLEVLEIKMIFPYILKTLSDKLLFKYNNNNIQSLMLIINKMKKLQKLKLIGNYLYNYDLNYLKNNNIKDLSFKFQIMNKSDNNSCNPCLKNTFCAFNKMKSISLNYNNINYNSKNKIKTNFHNIIFKFPENLSILKFSNFTEQNFLKSYLIPLLNENKDKFQKINEIKIDNCYLNLKDFSLFLDMILLFHNLFILSINNCYNEFGAVDLLQFVSQICSYARELIELDLRNNKCEEEELLETKFLLLSSVLNNNLINLRIINDRNTIPNFTVNHLKSYFGTFLDYENVSNKYYKSINLS